MMEKFLCVELKTGITVYGGLNLIYSIIAAMFHFGLSVSDENALAATDQTFLLVINFVNILMSACLTYGAYMSRRQFLLPYLISACFALTILTFLILFLLTQSLLLVLVLPIIAFGWYIWYAVLSLYQMLDPRNPNYVPQQEPATVVYVEDAKPPAYYDAAGADAV